MLFRLSVALCITGCGAFGPVVTSSVHGADETVAGRAVALPELDADRAYDYLVSICRLGPRPSGSRGMADQQKLLQAHFLEHGAHVQFQSFDTVHPTTGQAVRLNNMIVTWHPDATERVLFACHYDTRPFPDRDLNGDGVFLGANDGGSGAALMMELAHHLPHVRTDYGVDFVLFDAEEFIIRDRGQYFLGSEKFARDYRDNPPRHRYVSGILVDMIADRRLNLYIEKNSWKYAPELTRSIWDTAKRLNVNEFIDSRKYEVQDDHLALNTIAKIPTCDLIDFEYGGLRNPYWHTTKDVPANCSGESLAKVGRVLLAWLAEKKHPVQ